MRYAIISDIHANRQALKAVLTDIRGIGADRIIALGDLVGYGPSPAEVLEATYGAVHFFVLGNHDAVVSGQLSGEYFNDRARQVIDWTRSVLDRKAAEFFQAQPLLLHGEGCRFTHGDFIDPGRFDYIIEPDEALANFRATQEPVLFAGHSHMPGIYVIGSSGQAHWLKPQDFEMEPEKRYIVNVGSVGQPRDDDIRASYCLFDPAKGEVLFRKVPFDLDAYREDLRRTKVPEAASYFLSLEAGKPGQSLRNIVDFRTVRKGDSVRTAEDIRSLTAAAQGYRRLRVVVWLLAPTLLAGAAVLAWLHHTGQLVRTEVVVEAGERRHVVPAANRVPRHLGPPRAETELLAMPQPNAGVGLESPLAEWTWECGDPASQRLSVETDPEIPDSPFFRLASGLPAPVDLTYLSVPVEPGTRYTIQAQFKRVTWEVGFVEIQLEHELPGGVRRIVGRTAPKNFAEKTAWTPVSWTMSKDQPLEAGGKIHYRLHGEFKGEILIRKCSLKGRE